MDAHACKSGRPKVAELGVQYLCVGDRSLPELGAHFLRWPCELYASGRPIRNVADHPELWVPIDVRGHAICNAWTQVGAHIFVWAHVWKWQKNPHSLWEWGRHHSNAGYFLLRSAKFTTLPLAQRHKSKIAVSIIKPSILWVKKLPSKLPRKTSLLA